MEAVTLFSFGYAGWGNSIPQLLHATAEIERSRGFEPPVFVDVRARRAGRAKGFRGDTFERSLSRDRYRWMPGLGNLRVLLRRGRMRLVRPAEAYELLGLALSEQRRGRRVLFFCSCPSPWQASTCHRRLVANTLKGVAKRLRVRLHVDEWPGGRPGATPVELRVDPR